MMVQLQNATVTYPNDEVMGPFTFTVSRGEFLFIVGPSGAGKSTILKLIYMEQFPSSGRVRVCEYDSEFIYRRQVPQLRRRLGIVFQDFKLLNDRNVFENVAFALRVTHTRGKEIKRRVFRVLGEVGLLHKRYKMPVELSGGEQQRVAIARALVNEPQILLADEPTGNLDRKTAELIMQLLVRINEKGTAVLMATHDTELIRGRNTGIVHIDRGKMSV